ncbi:septum formation family protein [Dactylosporangium sp. AC04546]|uniref:septum formation family protein n=1 Tax=Dactylosporangium sp. AC04546 TaxID=2862460 RepID=UPI001EE11B7E|nr:septum formation family protein [Dactylosporangium sp. AC04546]WVK83646.1 septum formation family protein [Dactylosporangium sp. AC04546]
MEEPEVVFDQEWVEAAKRREDDMRRHTSPQPAYSPAPWRAWTPPAPARPAVRRRVSRWSPTASILIGVTTVLGMLVALVLCGLAAGALRTVSRDHQAAAPPVFVSSPAAAPASTVPAAAPAPASAPPVSAPPRRLPWAPATTLPVGENAYHPEVFARLVVGSCLAETPDLHSATLVPCSGPHTDEVTRVDSLTNQFSTLPTLEQVDVLNDQRCPPAANAWLGGADPQYTSGYLWWFENGAAGVAVRGFVCTVTRTGHQPFTGTLRHAVA